MGYKCRIFDRVLVYFSIWEPLLQYHKRAIGSLYKGQEKVLKIRTKHQNHIKTSKPHSPGSIARSWPGSPETAATPRGIRDSWTPPQCPASNPQTHPDRGQAAPRKDPGKQKENLKKWKYFRTWDLPLTVSIISFFPFARMREPIFLNHSSK